MSYREQKRYKTEKFKNWTRKDNSGEPKTLYLFNHSKPPALIFKDVPVLDAIEQCKADRKLSQQVGKVVNSSRFNTFDPEYQEHIKAIADEIRKQKLY